MSKLLLISSVLIISGCAQFSGMESESKQGLIPELLILGSSDSMVAENELIQEQAQYYAASSRAMYYQDMVDQVSGRSAQKNYKQKALKAKQVALQAEGNILSLSK